MRKQNRISFRWIPVQQIWNSGMRSESVLKMPVLFTVIRQMYWNIVQMKC